MGKHRIHYYTHSPQQQVSAVVAARDFLLRLTRPLETPRVPGLVRTEARSLLRHFPLEEDLKPVLESALLPHRDAAGEVGGEVSNPDPVIAMYFSENQEGS